MRYSSLDVFDCQNGGCRQELHEGQKETQFLYIGFLTFFFPTQIFPNMFHYSVYEFKLTVMSLILNAFALSNLACKPDLEKCMPTLTKEN